MSTPELVIAVLVSLIGAGGTVIAALLTKVSKTQREFRSESSTQHGALMSMVERIDARTERTEVGLDSLRDRFMEHLVRHDPDATASPEETQVPPTKKRVTKRTSVR